MLDTVVISGKDVCFSGVFGTMDGVFVFSVMWHELPMISAFCCPLWLSVYEYQTVKCKFTSPVYVWCVCDILYAVLYVRVSCLVCSGWMSRGGI